MAEIKRPPILNTGDIIGIEFDQGVFVSTEQCYNWIKERPEVAQIMDNRYFKLKTITKSAFMSYELRRVWAWYGNLSRHKKIEFQRPEQCVLIIRAAGTDYWSSYEQPSPSMKFQARMQKAEERRREKEIKKSRKQEENRKKKRKKESTLKGATLKESTLIKIPNVRKKVKKNEPSVKQEPLLYPALNSLLDADLSVLDNVS